MAQDQTAAAEKSAMLMSATGGSPAGVGSEYVIEPPSTLTAEDSDGGSDGENDDDIPLDRQARPLCADDALLPLTISENPVSAALFVAELMNA